MHKMKNKLVRSFNQLFDHVVRIALSLVIIFSIVSFIVGVLFFCYQAILFITPE